MCLGAESKPFDDTERCKQGHSAACKVLRAPTGKDKGQFENKIGAALDGVPRPCPFIEYTRCAALGKTAAHSDDNPI